MPAWSARSISRRASARGSSSRVVTAGNGGLSGVTWVPGMMDGLEHLGLPAVEPVGRLRGRRGDLALADIAQHVAPCAVSRIAVSATAARDNNESVAGLRRSPDLGDRLRCATRPNAQDG